jgi:hypothetical protein
MAERAPRAAVDGPGGSPVPEGYGALDDAPVRVPRSAGSGRGANGRASNGRVNGRTPGGGAPMPPPLRPPVPAPAAPPPARTGLDAPTIQVGTAEVRAAAAAPVAPVRRRPLPPQGRRPAPVGPGGAGAPGVPVAPGSGRGEEAAVEAAPAAPKRRFRRQKVRVLRSTSSRRLVRRIDTWTVFKVSLFFYLLGLAILVVAGVILWNVASTFGTITSIQKSVKTLFVLNSFVLKPIPLLEYTAAGGGVLVVLGTLVNTTAAVLYNLISDVVGGIQVVVVTEAE